MMEGSEDDPNNSGGRSRRPRAAATSSKSKPEEKRSKKRKSDVSIEALYKQENYKEVCPTSLETIFESPRNSKRKSSSGRETRKRESTKGNDNENFSIHKLKRFCQFGSYYYPTKQKETMRKSRAKKIRKKGIKIPQGGVITNEEIQAALANLSDEENDQNLNNSLLNNSNRNATLDVSDLFDFKTPTKQGYKKLKQEESSSIFYSGNIIKPDETSDALMENTLKNMMKNMDLDELKDIKLPFTDETKELGNDDGILNIPDFFDGDTTLGFESKRSKSSRRRSGRVTDIRNSGIFLPMCTEESTVLSEMDKNITSEHNIIPDNNQIVKESDIQNNALEGRLGRRGRASNASIHFTSFFEENSPIVTVNKNKKSKRRSGRVEIMRNKDSFLQIPEDEDNLTEQVTENLNPTEAEVIKESLKKCEDVSLSINIAAGDENIVNNLKEHESGVRRGRQSNASCQYTSFFEESSPVSSTKNVKKSRRLLDEIQKDDEKISLKSDLQKSPVNVMITMNSELQESFNGKLDITSDNISANFLNITQTKASKKKTGRPAKRGGRRRVSGVDRPLYRQILSSPLSPNSSVNNSTDTSMHNNAVESFEEFKRSPCTLMAELTIKSPDNETSRGCRRSTRKSVGTGSGHVGNVEKKVESKISLTNNKKSGLLDVPPNIKKNSTKKLKSNNISIDDSIHIKKSSKEQKDEFSSSQCRTDENKDEFSVLFPENQTLQVPDLIFTRDMSSSTCDNEKQVEHEQNCENMSKTPPSGESGTMKNKNTREDGSGKNKKIKLSDILIGSKMKSIKVGSLHSDGKVNNDITNSPIISGIFNGKKSIRMGKVFKNKEKEHESLE